MPSLKYRIKKKILSKVIEAKRYNAIDNHYLFADPRGGSTWLMEIIQGITEEPVIWEPLHLSDSNHRFKDLNFSWRQYIPDHAEWGEAKEVFDLLFNGDIQTNRLHDPTFSSVLSSKSLLFKICRGSALLPWLVNQYDFKYKPVYLIRHPFAVVASQLKHGAWNTPFNGYGKGEKKPFNENNQKHWDFLQTIKTKEEALVVEWCLGNYPALLHKDNNEKWITINYEDFVLNPEVNIKRILDAWGIDFDVTKIDFDRNSVTTKNSTPKDKMARISNWKENFTIDQLESMGRVLDYFDIGVYSKANPLPEVCFERTDFEKM